MNPDWFTKLLSGYRALPMIFGLLGKNTTGTE